MAEGRGEEAKGGGVAAVLYIRERRAIFIYLMIYLFICLPLCACAPPAGDMAALQEVATQAFTYST